MSVPTSQSAAAGLHAVKRPSLRSRILHAGSWSMAGHLMSQVLRIGSSLILTRLLVPDMFGIIAIAGVIQVAVTLLSDLGLRQAIVQSPRGDAPEMLNTAWSIQILQGSLIWMVCLLVAGTLHVAGGQGWIPATSVYASPLLPAIVAVACFNAVIHGFASTKAMTKSRKLDLKRITSIELIAQAFGVLVTCLLAWWLRSIWSIVIGGFVTATVSVWMSHAWLPGPSNRFAFDRDCVRELVSYGRWVLLSSSLYVFAANGDRLLVGGWMGASYLGFYMLALHISTVVEGLSSRFFSAVAMPALSEVARNERHRFKSVYLRLRLPFDLVFIGSAGFLFAAGPTVVKILYDPRYAEVGNILQVLSFALLFARFGLTSSAYLALGLPRNLSFIHAIKLASVLVVVPAAYYLFGIQAALWAIAFQLAPALPMMYWFNHKQGLNDFRFELLVLLAWPGGYVVGVGAAYLATVAGVR